MSRPKRWDTAQKAGRCGRGKCGENQSQGVGRAQSGYGVKVEINGSKANIPCEYENWPLGQTQQKGRCRDKLGKKNRALASIDFTRWILTLSLDLLCL